jgi:hypothetical protein
MTNPKKPREIRASGYRRNMEAMEAYKGCHPCVMCGKQYPHYIMEFETPKKGWSVSRMAGSRCKLEDLHAAMERTDVLCANCKKERQWQEK